MQQVARKSFVWFMCAVVTLMLSSLTLVALPGTAEAKTPALSKTSMTVMVGGSRNLKVKRAPKNSKIVFKSSNTKVAKVSNQGKITGKKAGSAKITATVKKSGKVKKKLTCKVKVRQAVVAVIDSGAKKSQKVAKALTVIGGSPYGTISHGHKMIDYVHTEAPGAQIISIKASDDGGYYSSDLADAVRMAIDNKATIISISIVGWVDPYGDYYAAVEDALSKGITVVAAAGNDYGADARKAQGLSQFKKVKVVGASDGKKILKRSNIHANVYIRAKSTSTATARYAGMLANGHIYDAIYK